MDLIKMFLCAVALALFISLIISIVTLIWNPTTYHFKHTLINVFLYFIFQGLASAAIKDEK